MGGPDKTEAHSYAIARRVPRTVSNHIRNHRTGHFARRFGNIGAVRPAQPIAVIFTVCDRGSKTLLDSHSRAIRFAQSVRIRKKRRKEIAPFPSHHLRRFTERVDDCQSPFANSNRKIL